MLCSHFTKFHANETTVATAPLACGDTVNSTTTLDRNLTGSGVGEGILAIRFPEVVTNSTAISFIPDNPLKLLLINIVVRASFQAYGHSTQRNSSVMDLISLAQELEKGF